MDAHFSNARRGRRRALLPLPIPSNMTSSSVSTSATSTSTSSTSTSVSSTSTEVTTSTSITPTPTSTLTTATSTFNPGTSTVTESGSTITVVQSASTQATASISPSSTAVAASQQSFLQNKALAGIVLSFVGLIGLVCIISVVAFFIRRRRNNRIVEEALSFDPVPLRGGSPDMSEAKRRPGNIRTSSSTGHTSASHGNATLVGAFGDYAQPGPFSPNRSQSFAQKANYSAGAFPNGQQPYMQRYEWASAPAQPDAAYQHIHHQASQLVAAPEVAAPEVDPPRPSQASSGEFQFASVAPFQPAARRQDV
ncbi:hypothetical protein HYPSUDRAFT_50482 [Hypholoma sublateritium FD-334 SS-4]|uniref:Mid2 domain-containing protein n=1 Tax=Hypholoma sublateritium (strain FD-334 SS-4) TaxID=945553 RepID=A0A0D2PPI1_HYPSF|nr:hypothetical protein HYPSUDRAFT_50482 [Hypholoma sublateritium FD-334 SS-4]